LHLTDSANEAQERVEHLVGLADCSRVQLVGGGWNGGGGFQLGGELFQILGLILQLLATSADQIL
jgi:hypothetical protein